MSHPEWALKYKEKNMELRCINGKYYLYRVSAIYDAKKKRARKITGEFIGRITESDGLIPKGSERVKLGRPLNQEIIVHTKKRLTCKEYGAISQLLKMNTDIIAQLKIHFPNRWQEILVLAINRLLYQAPLKNMAFLYEESFVSETYPELNLSKNSLTLMIQEFGEQRDKVRSFMQNFVSGSEHLVFDITDVVSQSKKVKMASRGYNSHYSYDPQVNLFYLFAIDRQLPVFYRIFPGNISGMKALEVSMNEAKVKDALVIGDKGFYSNENMEKLEAIGLKFILPLRRDSGHIDYTRLNSRRYEDAFDGHFLYQNRPIFHYTLDSHNLFFLKKKPEKSKNIDAYIYYENNILKLAIENNEIQIKNKNLIERIQQLSKNFDEIIKIKDREIRLEIGKIAAKNKSIFLSFDENKKVHLFCDKSLHIEEEASYLKRLQDDSEGYSLEEYKTKELTFGTIAMITNMNDALPQKIYNSFKTRMEVETVFDSYKNLLEVDKSYMQSDNSMNGWMFINHISVMMYYNLLNIIKSKELVSTISPREILLGLSKINKVKVEKNWILAEINSKFMKVLKKLDIHIT